MSDFDAILKEVEGLREEHDKLKTEIPKLEEQKRGLTKEVDALHAETVKLDKLAEEINEENLEAVKKNDRMILSERQKLDEERLSHVEAVDRLKQEVEQQELSFKQQSAELDKRELEVKVLLERQTETEERIGNEMKEFSKLVSAHANDVKDFNRKKKEFDGLKEKLESQFGKSAIDTIQSTLDEKIKKAEGMTKEAESVAQRASKLLKNAKDRELMVSLKEDEYKRKEAMLETEKARLRKLKVSLDDRAAVYNSNKL